MPPNNNTNSTKEKSLDNKLKYLAHMHHPTSMVGKLAQKPVDLANVQRIIDEAKYGIFPDDEGLDETGNETTDATSPDKSLMKRSRLTRDYYSDDDESGGGYDEKELSYDDLSDYDEYIGDRRKTSKKSKKRNKGHRERLKTVEEPKKEEEKVSPLSDFTEIQLKLTPEQEMDIHKFEEDLNAPPQPFHFDLDRFIKEKSLERPVVPMHVDEATTKKYFEFDKEKRDLHSKFEAYRNLVRGNKEIYSPNLAYNYNADYAKNYRKQLQTGLKNEKDENFIDNYYLLNDGNAPPSSSRNTGHDPKTPNLLDLDIDLRLNREFEDLEYEKEKVRQGEADITDDVKQPNNNHIYHFGAIR